MSSSEPPPFEDVPQGQPMNRRQLIMQARARMRERMRNCQLPEPSQSVPDPYANSVSCGYISRGRTGIVYDDESFKHKCDWDDKYPENPQRLTCILERCIEGDLLRRCERIPNPLRVDLFDKVRLKHSKKYFDKLKNVCQHCDLTILESESSQYDSVYFNKNTFDVACRCVSSVVNLVTAVAQREVQNGIAFVRPPGHHAMEEESNGYCFFNNVAIAVESVIEEGHAAKVLIVDIDVHHGQGTQRMFYDRNDVLYFSIHRYEHGTFWPNLFESNFNFIGKGDGLGYNVNVPLNETGLSDEDYLAIIFNILLPMSYEFNPDLIIVSAGYDAVIGCPEGCMNVTPGFYAHLITLLSGLARGKIAVVLEGGYFQPTLAEGAFMTLKALLGGPCPMLDPIKTVHPSVIEVICNVRRMLYETWTCFKVCEIQNPNEIKEDDHECNICYFGRIEIPPFPTRSCYPQNSPMEKSFYRHFNTALKERYTAAMDLPTYYVYDEDMLRHNPQVGDVERPERPERLTSIMKIFCEFGIDIRLTKTPIVEHDFTKYSPHSAKYLSTIDLNMPQTKDVYANEHTLESVELAVSGLLTLADVVMDGIAQSGVAIIRPPGHHAEADTAMGFCFVNNVAVAANYLVLKHHVKRVLIVDFDIHHGNGTQSAFYDSKEVMYISIHKDENGKFFPVNSNRSYTYDGHGCGKGFNINIPFNKDKMGDTEYLAAFHNIILPAAYSYSPQIVLVSAGFDAGIHDPLGGYGVSPETFGHFIHMLRPLAEGRLIIALEGGYNLTTTSYGMAIATKALLGDPVMMPKNVYKEFSKEAIKTIRQVTNHFKKYYGVFRVNKRLAASATLVRKVDKFTEATYDMELTKSINMGRACDSEYVEKLMRLFNDNL